MSENNSQTPEGPVRYAAYAAIGAAIGVVAVYFVADGFGLASIGAGVVGGAIAGALAGFIRTRAGLDQ